jgi:hypothetical protein
MRAGILRDQTSDIRVLRMKVWSDLHGDMQEMREHPLDASRGT